MATAFTCLDHGRARGAQRGIATLPGERRVSASSTRVGGSPFASGASGGRLGGEHARRRRRRGVDAQRGRGRSREGGIAASIAAEAGVVQGVEHRGQPLRPLGMLGVLCMVRSWAVAQHVGVGEDGERVHRSLETSGRGRCEATSHGAPISPACSSRKSVAPTPGGRRRCWPSPVGSYLRRDLRGGLRRSPIPPEDLEPPLWRRSPLASRGDFLKMLADPSEARRVDRRGAEWRAPLSATRSPGPEQAAASR